MCTVDKFVIRRGGGGRGGVGGGGGVEGGGTTSCVISHQLCAILLNRISQSGKKRATRNECIQKYYLPFEDKTFVSNS